LFHVPEASSLIANHRGDAQGWHTEKTVQGSLTGAGFDVGRTSPDEKKYGEISRK